MLSPNHIMRFIKTLLTEIIIQLLKTLKTNINKSGGQVISVLNYGPCHEDIQWTGHTVH